MQQSTVTILSLFLGIVSYFAFQTGHFAIGAIGVIIQGALAIYVGPTRGKRVLGALMIAFGLYVLALVLGLLLHGALLLLGIL